MSSLLASGAPAKVAPLGMVLHAERAHVGQAELSAGSTIFEGERLSTDTGGILRISLPGLTMQLGGQSAMVISDATGPDGNTLAELASGSLLFSATPTASMMVVANEAVVRPAAKATTVAQIRVVNRKELRIYAQKGALEFSYHGEREAVAEGKSCRVILDPSEREVAELASDQTPHPPKKPHTTFILVAIAAVTLGIAIPVIIHGMESPDRPGPRLAAAPQNP